MRLEVKGMEQLDGRFRYFWAKYVSGFDSDHHCKKCLRGPNEDRVNLLMSNDNFELRDGFPYFYIFAMGFVPKLEPSMHLAVKPAPGNTVTKESKYGVVFIVHDAIEVEVEKLPLEWNGLDKYFTTCRNFQFGVQEFGYRPTTSLAKSS